MLSHSMRRAASGAGGGLDIISNGVTYTNDCDSLSSPTVFSDLDGGNSVSSQTTVGGDGVFKFQDGAYNAGNLAYRNNSAAYTPPVSTDLVVVSLELTINNTLGALAQPYGADSVQFYNGIQATTRCDQRLFSDGIMIADTLGVLQSYPLTMPDVGTKFIFTFAYKISTKKVDVYFDNVKVLTDKPTGASYSFPGRMGFLKVNRATSGYVDGSVYLHRVLVGDGFAT